jgi:hypothetical protein
MGLGMGLGLFSGILFRRNLPRGEGQRVRPALIGVALVEPGSSVHHPAW